MKKVFTALLALSVGMVSCNKSDDLVDRPQNSSTQIVALSVANQALTKAITSGVGNGDAVEFQGGYIVFTDGGDRITNFFRLTNDDTETYALSTDTLSLEKEDVLAGYPAVILIDSLMENAHNYFFKINPDAEFVHVFGNTDNHSLTFATGVKGKIEDYLERFLVKAQDLADANGGVQNVPLYGSGQFKKYSELPGSEQKEYSGDVEKIASVEIAPIASRLELAKLTPIASASGWTITDYELDGVFLNYFHKEMAFNGVLESSAGFIAFNSLDDFEENAPSTAPWYSAPFNKVFYDYNSKDGIAAPLTAQYEATPLNGDVWAYNMFQAHTKTGQAPQDALPHLVLKLKIKKVMNGGADITDTEFPNDFYYITIRRYTNSGNPVEAFEGGVIYYIPNLPFSTDNLKEVPEWREAEVVEVMFRVMDWSKVNVDVDLD